jgi:hypothetical protein
MNTDNTYNGWTNYATWRVNLEIFDGIDTAYFRNLDDSYELSKELREYAEEFVTNFGQIDPNSLAVSYAVSFLSYVNWQEIAESIIDNYKLEEK